MKKTLYVGNLSRETTEAQLKELFDQAGFVERVRIIRNRATGLSKGFGFVDMNDGGDNAILILNGRHFVGRVLTVHDAREKLFVVLPIAGDGCDSR